MALLVGNPSSGKSIFSYALGMNLTDTSAINNGYYMDIDTVPQEYIIQHIESLNNETSYFIIDNIHLNTDLTYEIYLHFESQKIKILFIGRNIDKNFFEIEDIINIYAIFENQNKLYKLKNFNKDIDRSSILEKVKTIIIKFKEINSIPSEIGEDSKIKQMIGDNFVLLYYYLEYWEEQSTTIFTSLTKTNLLKRMWTKINNDLNKDQQDLERLLSIAILYQYEICAYNVNNTVLTQKGLARTEDESYEEPCSFYHSNYAKLVIDAYCETMEFKRTKKTRDELNITYLKNHFEQNYEYISLSHELVKLRNNSEDNLLTNLLEKVENDKIEEYFLVPNQKTTLRDFNIVFNILINYKQKNLAESILSKLINSNFASYDLNIIGLINLYNNVYHKNCNTLILNTLKVLIEDRQKNIKISDTHLSVIGHVLVVLKKINKRFSKNIYENLDLNMLTKLANDSSAIGILGEGLNNLNTIDKVKTAEIYKSLELDMLTKLANDSSTIGILGKGLVELNTIDKVKTAEIYKSLEISKFITEYQHSIVHSKLNLFKFNLLSTIIIRRDKNDEISLLKKFYDTFIENKFYCIGCNDLSVIANTIKNLKQINIDVIQDIDSKLFSFIANSFKKDNYKDKIPYLLVPKKVKTSVLKTDRFIYDYSKS